MSLKSVWLNLKKRGLKDLTDPSRIKNYLDGSKIEKEGIHLDYDEIQSYCEQLVYRLSNAGCADCVKSGNCAHCGCEVPLSMMVKPYECSGGNFVGMMEPKQWEEYKKETGLYFKIDYRK